MTIHPACLALLSIYRFSRGSANTCACLCLFNALPLWKCHEPLLANFLKGLALHHAPLKRGNSILGLWHQASTHPGWVSTALKIKLPRVRWWSWEAGVWGFGQLESQTGFFRRFPLLHKLLLHTGNRPVWHCLCMLLRVGLLGCCCCCCCYC